MRQLMRLDHEAHRPHYVGVLQHCSTDPRAICVSQNINEIADKRDAMRESREPDRCIEKPMVCLFVRLYAVYGSYVPWYLGRIKIVNIASGRFRC